MTLNNPLPYRPNVGAALFNRRGEVLVAKRADLQAFQHYPWQLPQGGIDGGEEPRRAVLRELQEEIGTDAATIIGEIPDWLTYEFPAEVLQKFGNRYGGQRQRWFALRFWGTDDLIRLDADAHPEFSDWRWVPLTSIVDLAVPFKRHIYQSVVEAFSQFTITDGANNG